MESSSQDKNLPATPQRLKKARGDGQVPNSKDLSNLAVLGGGALVMVALLPTGFESLRMALRSHLRFDHSTLQKPEQMLEIFATAGVQGMLLALPLGLVVLAIALAAIVASGGFALSSKPLVPDLTRLSPLKGIGQLFSKQKLTDTAKLAGITAVIGVVAWQFIGAHVAPFATLVLMPLEGALGQLGSWISTGVTLLLVVVLLFAVIDVPLQKFLHANRLKMSFEEVKREHKEAEGDPHVKSQRRARQRELSQRNSIGAVPRADLVVMNPTKGADLLALRIRDVAKASDVPVLHSPMLARALYAHAEIDSEIPAALYTAVAQVLAYVYQLKASLKGEGAAPAAMPVPEVPPELDPHHNKATP
jgi:flagellar biosynthesis protein FlhB